MSMTTTNGSKSDNTLNKAVIEAHTESGHKHCSYGQQVHIRKLNNPEFTKKTNMFMTKKTNMCVTKNSSNSRRTSNSYRTSNKAVIGPQCTDYDNKHCGVFMTNIPRINSSESNNDDVTKNDDDNINTKLCPNPNCRKQANSNVEKNCKACKHKFVIKCKKASSLQGKSNKKCICGIIARSNRLSTCECGRTFPSGHKTKKKKPKKSKKVKKKKKMKRKNIPPLKLLRAENFGMSIDLFGNNFETTIQNSNTLVGTVIQNSSVNDRQPDLFNTPLNERQSSLELIGIPPLNERQSSLGFSGYVQEESIEPVWDPSTIRMSPSALSRQSSLDTMIPSALSRQTSIDSFVKVSATKENEDSMLGLGFRLMQDNINVWMQG